MKAPRCAALTLAMLTTAGSAAASSGIDSPESGVTQVGRGSAWLARADDPLAVYFNPAALAFQASGVHVGAQLMFMNRCFTRKGPGNVVVSPGDAAGALGSLPGPGAPLDPDSAKQVPPPAEVCSDKGAFPNPQIAATFRLTNRLAVGVALVAPHASGNNNWPETVPYTTRLGIPTTQPAPNRYMLVSSEALIVFPTVGVGYAIADNLSIGASFLWGVAIVDFVNFSEGISPPGAATPSSDQFSRNSDLRAHLSGKDLFIPGFAVSAFWAVTPRLDVSIWAKWTDALRINAADVNVTARYWDDVGGVRTDACAMDPNGDKACNITDAKGVGSVKFSLPMEVKLGARYHHPRAAATRPKWADKPGRRVRDPLSEDLFDLEFDFTWAQNSVVGDLEIGFPKKPQIPVKGTPSFLPSNANVPHNWVDVAGLRLGGDFVVLPSRLALRAGGFFETQGQDDRYLGLDFDVAQKIGVSGGATVRIGPVDVALAYQHTFFATLDNKGRGAVKALSGDQTAGFRSQQAINGGSLRASLNEAGLAGTFRW